MRTEAPHCGLPWRELKNSLQYFFQAETKQTTYYNVVGLGQGFGIK